MKASVHFTREALEILIAIYFSFDYFHILYWKQIKVLEIILDIITHPFL